MTELDDLIERLSARALEMRHAIDMMESAMMGLGDLIEIPEKFDGVRDDLELRPIITLGQLRQVCNALTELTRIINSEEFAPAALKAIKAGAA